jgi:PKD repeat protein
LRSPRAFIPLLVVLLVAVGASSASAVIVHLKNGKALSFQALRSSRSTSGAPPSSHVFDEAFKNLDYNGGPVMPSNTNYVIYWAPTGGSAYPAGYEEGVNQYLTDLSVDSGKKTNVDSVSAQYNDATGEFAAYDSHFGGALADTDPYPSIKGCSAATKCFTDAQLQKEIREYVEKHGLPADLTHEYFLLTPPEVESCFEASGVQCSAGSSEPFYCAYHGNIPLKTGGEIIYSNDPYVTGILGCDDGEHPNGKPSDGALEGGLSHEHNESITDPEPNNAWTDFATGEQPESGFEIGDKCASEMGTPLGEVEVGGKKVPYNQEINGHKYWYQEEWSNQGHLCRQSFTFQGSHPTAKFTARVGASTHEILFDASESSAAGGVRDYSWQFNNGEFLFAGKLFTHQPNWEESTLPTEFAFFSSGTYRVALTVYAQDGTGIGTARNIKVGGPGPTARFSVSPGSPAAGQTISFNGSESSDPEGGIESYSWNFGDGSGGTGSSPSHSYASAGSYKVTVTVTGKDGLSASVSREVVVAGPPAAVPAVPGPAVPAVPTVLVPPNANFGRLTASLNPTTGAITFTGAVSNPGTFRWLLTFQNGKFGVFAASAPKCKRGFVRLNKRCRPAKIVFAKGSKVVAAPGTVSFTVKPSASALKALKNALKQRKGLPVTATFTFQSSRGGSAVTHTQPMTVKLKKT